MRATLSLHVQLQSVNRTSYPDKSARHVLYVGVHMQQWRDKCLMQERYLLIHEPYKLSTEPYIWLKCATLIIFGCAHVVIAKKARVLSVHVHECFCYSNCSRLWIHREREIVYTTRSQGYSKCISKWMHRNGCRNGYPNRTEKIQFASPIDRETQNHSFWIPISTSRYSPLHLECHFFIRKSQSMI